ncbi:hypothetical protein BKA82DRAFT_4326410 [Pisolithus tinctorius]|nr:hypothetical protein BKA82DRAFT_4326410 [Pisolithus tinctorius]
MRDYFAVYEPHPVCQCKAHRLQCRRFWAAGVNDIWAVDQHDNVEPFSGKIFWIHVWHSNQNPQLILSYYLNVIEEFGFIPLVTQSDPGSENFGIANAQTMLHQWHEPALAGTLQHQWMRSKKNIKPEIMWSQLHQHFTPGFEALLEDGVQPGMRVNHTSKWHDCNKVGNSWSPLGCSYCKPVKSLTHVHQLYIDPNHLVFDLVPGPLNMHLEECYNRLGRPPVTHLTVWDVYLDLLHTVQDHTALHIV